MPCLCNEISLWWTPTPHLNQGNLQEMEPRPELEHSVLKHLDHQIKILHIFNSCIGCLH